MTDTAAGTEYRIEHDTMGEVRVPAAALYGAQTQRAVENFPISGDSLDPAQLIALARIKKAAALANKQLGTLDAAIADAIAAAADEVIGGGAADQFPIDVYQTEMEIVIKSTIAGVKPEDLQKSVKKALELGYEPQNKNEADFIKNLGL